MVALEMGLVWFWLERWPKKKKIVSKDRERLDMESWVKQIAWFDALGKRCHIRPVLNIVKKTRFFY
jgi:hypothetical protein